MVDEMQGQEVLRTNFNELIPEQVYLMEVLKKFNENPDHPELSELEKVVLKQVMVVEKEVSELAKKGIEIYKEIEERQNQITQINQQIVHKKGQSQGLVDSLLLAKKA